MDHWVKSSALLTRFVLFEGTHQKWCLSGEIQAMSSINRGVFNGSFHNFEQSFGGCMVSWAHHLLVAAHQTLLRAPMPIAEGMLEDSTVGLLSKPGLVCVCCHVRPECIGQCWNDDTQAVH